MGPTEDAAPRSSAAARCVRGVLKQPHNPTDMTDMTVAGSADSTLFQLDHVTLSRAGRTVLQDVSTRLPNGATCVAGPSGCGKSTLLRLLNRLADPDAGRVTYRGREVTGYDVLELRREVSLVPQLPALLDGTVESNIRFAAGLAQREARVEELLELGGLDGSFAERDASRLSVGEQQRVMLARSLAVGPSVLLLDEPTASLDESARDAVEATLLDLRDRLDLSLVLVTHDLEQAERMSDWVLRLDHGTVVGESQLVRE
jgi:putative ABC transport system ATP-binding protein